MGELISQEKRRELKARPLDCVHHSFHMKEVCEQDFRLPEGASIVG